MCEKLRANRKERKLRQKDIAIAANCPQAYVSYLENGSAHKVPEPILRTILEAYQELGC